MTRVAPGRAAGPTETLQRLYREGRPGVAGGEEFGLPGKLVRPNLLQTAALGSANSMTLAEQRTFKTGATGPRPRARWPSLFIIIKRKTFSTANPSKPLKLWIGVIRRPFVCERGPLSLLPHRGQLER